MPSNAGLFLANDPRAETVWRAIVLYGGNSATYKFALAKSLLKLRPQAGDTVELHELAVPYSKYMMEHLKRADRQVTTAPGKFLKACKKRLNKEITEEELIEHTVEQGFQEVLKAFHNVDRRDLRQELRRTGFFQLKNENRPSKGIVIGEDFSSLSGSYQVRGLEEEVEARWRLVEAAWELHVSRALLGVEYHRPTECLHGVASNRQRSSLAGARAVLNSIQKGECFYCCDRISLSEKSLYPDVEHFFPFVLVNENGFGGDVDGIWNLVLACQGCNSSKGIKLPNSVLQHKLLDRNQMLINSKHPLRETLVNQYGGESEQIIESFHRLRYNEARNLGRLVEWAP